MRNAKKHDLSPHPLAAIVPMIRGAAFDALVADIEANGQHEPIVVAIERGKWLVVDGRNRLAACERLGIEPKIRTFGERESDGDNLLAFVLSENVHRRHLNERQRCVIATKLATREPGRPENNPANLPVLTQPEAAAMLGVAERSVRHARTALECIDPKTGESRAHRVPSFVQAVELGMLPISQAARLAERPDLVSIVEKADFENAIQKSQHPEGMKALRAAIAEMMDGDESSADEPRQTSGRGKPEWLMRALVRHYTRGGESVCDPFAGYGSTLRAARAEGRTAFGAEIDAKTAAAADDPDLRVGRWENVLGDVEVDAVICDPPYSERTHAAGTTRADASSAGGLTPTYAAWTPDDVRAFVDGWHPRCRGWIVALTDSELIPAYRDAFRAVGRYAFAPVPIVIRGMSVRVSNDGPSSWCVYAMVARPSTEKFVNWGTLPGAYVGTKTRALWNPEALSEESRDGE